MAGATTLTRPSSDESPRGHDADHPGRLGAREVEVRPGDRVGAAVHLGDLVRPAGVPDPAVDRGVHRAPRAAAEPSPRDLVDELRPPALQHLRDPVEDLARGCTRWRRPTRRPPPGPRPPRRGRPCARPSAALARNSPARRLHRVGPAGLAARERAADEELVRLADRQTPRPVAARVSGQGRPPGRAGRPRGRNRTPCTRRTGDVGSNLLNVLAHTTPARSWSAIARIREPFSRPDPRGQAVRRVVGLLHRLGRGAEGEHRQHRPEDLLAGDAVRLGDAGEDGRREPEAAVGQLARRRPAARRPRPRRSRTSVRMRSSWAAELIAPMSVFLSSGSPTRSVAIRRLSESSSVARRSTPAPAAGSRRSRRAPG